MIHCQTIFDHGIIILLKTRLIILMLNNNISTRYCTRPQYDRYKLNTHYVVHVYYIHGTQLKMTSVNVRSTLF